MEEQVEFSFMKEMGTLAQKTCINCKHADKLEPICKIDTSDTNKEFTCGDYEYDESSGMKEIAQYNAGSFIQLMDKYRVSEEDRETIYFSCRWF